MYALLRSRAVDVSTAYGAVLCGGATSPTVAHANASCLPTDSRRAGRAAENSSGPA